jgi:hypothetical protein
MDVAPGFPAERPKRFTREGPQKSSAQQSNHQQSAEKKHCIDAGPPLALPVHILKIQPEGEFIQCQGGADSVEERHGAPRPSRQAADICANLEQPAISYDQQQQDAPDEVVNMPPSKFDVVERTSACPNAVCEQPHDRESEEE